MLKKIFAVTLAILLPACALIASQQSILTTDTVKDALYVKVNQNFTELYNMLNGTTTVTLLTPTIASFANATHNHSNAAGGGSTLTSPTINTPTIASPTLSGTLTGTYTIGGTPTISWSDTWHNDLSCQTGYSCSGLYYTKDALGVVHLLGSIAYVSGSYTGVVATLPSGYRPPVIFYAPIALGSGSTTFSINTSGQITVYATAATLYFGGMSFPTMALP